MAQLTMKTLFAGMENLDARLLAIETAVSGIEDAIATTWGEGGPEVDLSSLLDRVIALEIDPQFSPLSGDGVPETPYGPIPEWGYDVLEGLVEALNSVRLARAMEMEQALVAKYFPEGLESSPYPEVVTITGE